MHQQTNSNNVPQLNGPSMESCVINQAQKKSILHHMETRYSDIMSYNQDGVYLQRQPLDYFVSRLSVPKKLQQVTQRRLKLLEMIGFSEEIISYDNQRYVKMIEQGIVKVINGEPIGKPAYLQIVEELCTKLVQNPADCLIRIKAGKKDKHLDISDDCQTTQIVLKYSKKWQIEWKEATNQMQEIMTQKSISFREKLERFMIVEKQLKELIKIRIFIKNIVQQQPKRKHKYQQYTKPKATQQIYGVNYEQGVTICNGRPRRKWDRDEQIQTHIGKAFGSLPGISIGFKGFHLNN